MARILGLGMQDVALRDLTRFQGFQRWESLSGFECLEVLEVEEVVVVGSPIQFQYRWLFEQWKLEEGLLEPGQTTLVLADELKTSGELVELNFGDMIADEQEEAGQGIDDN